MSPQDQPSTQQQQPQRTAAPPNNPNVNATNNNRINIEMLNIPVPKQLFDQIPNLPPNVKIWRDVLELGQSQRLPPEQLKLIGMLYRKHLQIILQHRQQQLNKIQNARMNLQNAPNTNKLGNPQPDNTGNPQAFSQQAFAQQQQQQQQQLHRTSNPTSASVTSQNGQQPINTKLSANAAKTNYQSYLANKARNATQPTQPPVSQVDYSNNLPPNLDTSSTFRSSASPPSAFTKAGNEALSVPLSGARNTAASRPTNLAAGNSSASIVQQLLECGGTMGQQKMTSRIRELTERVMHSLMRPVPLDLPHDQKVMIASLIKSAYPMFSRTNQLICLFYCLTGNEEATIQLIQMRHIFKLQLEGLQQGVFTCAPQTLAKIKEKTSRYFAFVKAQLLRLHHEVNNNNMSIQNALAHISSLRTASINQQQQPQPQQQQQASQFPQAPSVSSNVRPINGSIPNAQPSVPGQAQPAAKANSVGNTSFPVDSKLAFQSLDVSQPDLQAKQKIASQVMKHGLKPEDLKLPPSKKKKIENLSTVQKPKDSVVNTPDVIMSSVDEIPSSVSPGTIAKEEGMAKAREEAIANPLKYAIDAFVAVDHEEEVSAIKSSQTPSSILKTPQSFFIPPSTPDLSFTDNKNSLSPSNILSLDGKFSFNDDSELWADLGNEINSEIGFLKEPDTMNLALDADKDKTKMQNKLTQINFDESCFLDPAIDDKDPWNEMLHEKKVLLKQLQVGNEDEDNIAFPTSTNIWQVVI